jgi:hypothetical protein
MLINRRDSIEARLSQTSVMLQIAQLGSLVERKAGASTGLVWFSDDTAQWWPSDHCAASSKDHHCATTNETSARVSRVVTGPSNGNGVR